MTAPECSADEFRDVVEQLRGMVVTRPWMGYGSAIGLELAPPPSVGSTNPSVEGGVASIFIEWDWRVEHNSSVLYGSSNTRPRIEKGLTSIQGVAIESISVAGQVPELDVTFSNGHVLRSMVLVTGDPAWFIKLSEQLWISARAGRLLLGDSSYGLSEAEEQAFAHAERAAARWGTPVSEPARGRCRDCTYFVPIDGEGALLDYGVCISNESPFDGKIVNRNSGCPAHAVGT